MDRPTGSSAQQRLPSPPTSSSEERLNAVATQSAVTYEHVLNRYGYWRNVRMQVLVNFFLLFLGCFHKNHVDHVKSISSLHTVRGGRHPQCCCEVPARLQRSHDEQGLIAATSFYGLLPYILAVLVAFSAPSWERPFGRRLMTLILCGLGVVISPFLLFCTESVLAKVANHIIDMPSFLIIMIAISNIVELLPYNLRALAVALYHLAAALTKAIALLHFHLGFCFIQLGILSITVFVSGFYLVLRFGKESLCHLIMRNRADELLKRIEANEELLCRTNKEGSLLHHMAIAQKVFTDLTCAEQDELKFTEFLQHIGKSWITVEIVIAFLQSISSGIFEFEFSNFRKQLFVDPYFVQAETLVGYMVVLAVLFLLRKTERSKALIFLMCAMICVASLRHLVVRFDQTNKCSDHMFLQRQLNFAAFVLDSCFYGVCSSLQMMITLNFLEAVPSTLRLCSVAWVYLPLKVTQDVCKKFLREDRFMNPFVLLPIYAAHLAIVAVTIIRTRTNSRARKDKRISMYIFELMPECDDSVMSAEENSFEYEDFAERVPMVSESVPDVTSPLVTPKNLPSEMTYQQLAQISPVPTQAVYFLVSADGNQTMIIDMVPKRILDRSTIDISKLVDRVAELAKRMTGDKEYRLVWNDDEDDIFVTLDSVKRMKAAIDFAMRQSPEKPIVRILAKPLTSSPHSSSSSPSLSWSSSSPSSALSDAAMEDGIGTDAASAATITAAAPPTAAEDDDAAVASALAFCVASIAGDAGEVTDETAKAQEMPDEGMEEETTDLAAKAEDVNGVLLQIPAEKQTSGRPKKRPSNALVIQDKRRPGRPRKSLKLDSASNSTLHDGQLAKKILLDSNNGPANSPSVRPRRENTLVNTDKDNGVTMMETEVHDTPKFELCDVNEATIKETPVQEKRKPGRPRRSIIVESSATNTSNVGKRRKSMVVNSAKDNDVSVEQLAVQGTFASVRPRRKSMLVNSTQDNDVSMEDPTVQDTIKSEECDENANSLKETSVPEKRKPGRPRKSILVESPVPNTTNDAKQHKTIVDYFEGKSAGESDEALQEKKRTGLSCKSIIVEATGEKENTISKEAAKDEKTKKNRKRIIVETSDENAVAIKEKRKEEKKKPDSACESNIVKPFETAVVVKEVANEETKNPVCSRKTLMVGSANNEEVTSNNESAQPEKKKRESPRMSLPANVTIAKETKAPVAVDQEKQKPGRPRKSLVANCLATRSPIAQASLSEANNHVAVDTTSTIADKLQAEFDQWRGMRTAAVAAAAVAAAAAVDNNYATRALRLLSYAVRTHENRRKEMEMINQENIRVKTEFVPVA